MNNSAKSLELSRNKNAFHLSNPHKALWKLFIHLQRKHNLKMKRKKMKTLTSLTDFLVENKLLFRIGKERVLR